jgi:endonuclease I
MNNLILASVLAFSFTGISFTRQQTPPLPDNRLFKPAKIIESKKIQSLAFSIYKKEDVDLPYQVECLVDFIAHSKKPKKSKFLGKIFWRRGLSEKEAGRQLSKLEKNDMHNLFLFLEKNKKTTSEKEKCVDFRGSVTYSVPVDFKGDFARACFYMSIQYSIPLPDDWEDIMRMWHVMDPPNVSEMNRNSYIEEAQKNRNPFIDYPELAEKIINF